MRFIHARTQALPSGRQRLLLLTVLAPFVAILLRVALFQYFDPVELVFIIAPAVVAGASLFFLTEATSSQQRVMRSTSLALLIAASLLGKHWVGLLVVAPIFYGVMSFANTIDSQQKSLTDESSAVSSNPNPSTKDAAPLANKSQDNPAADTAPPSPLARNTDFVE